MSQVLAKVLESLGRKWADELAFLLLMSLLLAMSFTKCKRENSQPKAGVILV